VAAVLTRPALRDLVYRAVGPEDFASPVLQRLYNACLGLEGTGRSYDPKVLGGLLADDAEAAHALASLPEETTLDDLVPSQIEHLERRRRDERRRREFLQILDAPLETATDSALGPPAEDPSPAEPTG
jgi:hypothetical protein